VVSNDVPSIMLPSLKLAMEVLDATSISSDSSSAELDAWISESEQRLVAIRTKFHAHTLIALLMIESPPNKTLLRKLFRLSYIHTILLTPCISYTDMNAYVMGLIQNQIARHRKLPLTNDFQPMPLEIVTMQEIAHNLCKAQPYLSTVAAHSVLQDFQNLHRLSQATKEELRNSFLTEKEAEKLHAFFHGTPTHHY
jgi:hypothetical protein